MASIRLVHAIALSSLAVVLVACSSDGDAANIGETSLASDGSACAVQAPGGGELCFEYDDATVTLVASGLQPDSTVTVTGANGDSATFEVGSGTTIDAEVGARLVLAPFTATAMWNNGDAAVVTVDAPD